VVEAPVGEVTGLAGVEDVVTPATAALVSWGWPARVVKSPTPASEPAATQLVTMRLRRTQACRREGVVMSPI